MRTPVAHCGSGDEARPPAETFVTPLSNAEVDALAERVRRRTGLAVEAFYGAC